MYQYFSIEMDRNKIATALTESDLIRPELEGDTRHQDNYRLYTGLQLRHESFTQSLHYSHAKRANL